MKSTTRAEKNSKLPVFTIRFRSLFGDEETQEEFGNKVGLTRITVAQYFNGHRVPDSRTLKQICERCNVSADWLLGLSDVKKPDADLKAVSQYIGLSANAITNIKYPSFNRKIFEKIITDEETNKLFSDMLNNIVMAVQKPIITYNENDTVQGLLQDKSEFYILLAGRCAEGIAQAVKRMEEEKDGQS